MSDIDRIKKEIEYEINYFDKASKGYESDEKKNIGGHSDIWMAKKEAYQYSSLRLKRLLHWFETKN